MTQFMIIAIVIYLAWLTYYIIYVEPGIRAKDAGTPAAEEHDSPAADTEESVSIVGKSKFRMSVTVDATMTKRATDATKDDTGNEPEELSTEDVTFAPEIETRRPARLSPDEMKEAFEDIRIEDVTGEDDEPQYGEPADDMASGATYEDIDLAVRVAKGKETTQEEKERAAMVLTELQGTQLYERLTDGKEDIRMRIKLLIDLQMGNKAQTTKPASLKGSQLSVPDDLKQFNIRDYV